MSKTQEKRNSIIKDLKNQLKKFIKLKDIKNCLKLIKKK